jgi:DNA-binding beta-propeller fold protein YncE
MKATERRCVRRRLSSISLVVAVVPLLAASAWANRPPEVTDLAIGPVPASGGQTIHVTCIATDPENQPLTFHWSTADGSLSGGGDLDAQVDWTLPAGEGDFMVSVEVRDSAGAFTMAERLVPVGPVRQYRTLPGVLRRPTRLAVDADGSLWATDAFENEVVHFTPGGTVLSRFPAGPRPLGIAAGNDGSILVGEDARNRVARYSRDGVLLGVLGAGSTNISMPNAIDVDQVTGQIHVVDSSQQRVRVFSPEGALVRSYSSSSMTPFPVDLAVDSTAREVYLADQLTGQVSVFNMSGQRVRSFGSQGNLPGQFGRIQGIALDTTGRILVLDSYQNNVQILTSTGDPVATFGQFGAWLGAMQTPLGIAVIPGERVFAASTGTEDIQVFAYWTWYLTDSPATGLVIF